MSNVKSNPEKIESVSRVFHIAELLASQDGMGVTELANEVGVAKSTIHDHLSTLREMGYVIKDGNTYNLSLRFLRFGEYVRSRDKLYRSVHEDVQEIANETGQRTQFVAREEDMGIPLLYATGKKSMQYIGFDLGQPMSLHATAAGKAIFAHLPPETIDEIFETEFEQITENTITDPNELREELNTVREQGHAFNNEESFSSLKAVGVPVFDEDDRIIGSVSVSGAANKMYGDFFTSELPVEIKGFTNEIELKNKHL
jgi:DNA-binding IclR family transcriptional regulator